MAVVAVVLWASTLATGSAMGAETPSTIGKPSFEQAVAQVRALTAPMRSTAQARPLVAGSEAGVLRAASQLGKRDADLPDGARVANHEGLNRLFSNALAARVGPAGRTRAEVRLGIRAPQMVATHDGVILYAPPNGSLWTQGFLDFSWQSVWYCAGCDGLVALIIAADPGFQNVVYRATGSCPASAQPSCPTGHRVGGFAPGTYYWAVGVQLGSNPIHTSDVWSFTVTAAPTPPPPPPPPSPTPPPPPTPPSPPTVTVNKSLPTQGGPAAFSRVDPRYSQIVGVIAEITASARCWGASDWNTLSVDRQRYEGGKGLQFVLGFYVPGTDFVNLAPEVCARLDLLTYLRKRPQGRAKRDVANAVTTLTHEAIHLYGVSDEAITECYAMQLTELVAVRLGMSSAYGFSLGRLVWLYDWPRQKGTEYWTPRCYNGGPLDLFPKAKAWP